MISIKGRTYGNGTKVQLSLRVKNKSYDNATALNISIDRLQWELMSQNLKTVSEAYNAGTTILIRDPLTSKLWSLIQELQAMEKAGTLRYESKFISEVSRSILHRNEITEIKEVQKKNETNSQKPTFMEFVEQFIRECESGERLKNRSTRKITPGTIKNYKGFQAQMLEYQKSRRRVIDWDDLDLDFYRDYKQYFIEKNYSPNTIARHVKNMKTMLYAAKDLHLTTRDDFMSRQWSADREDVENIYIPAERLTQMAGFDMSDYQAMKERAERYARDDEERKGLIHALKRDLYRRKLTEARDIFVLGCLTGQRVSDYKRISTDMIETIQGDRKFLHLVQMKTDKDVYVPYNNIIGDILRKYKGRLPKIYDQHLNGNYSAITI